jgi:hypothetical protein
LLDRLELFNKSGFLLKDALAGTYVFLGDIHVLSLMVKAAGIGAGCYTSFV